MPTIPDDDLYSVTRWHFAIGGLDTEGDSLVLSNAIRLRRLREFPTDEQLATCLSSLPVAGIMAQYGQQVIQHELVLDAEKFEEHPEYIFTTVSAILAGLRICTGAEIVCPAVCARSWEALRPQPPNQCKVYHVERGLSHAPPEPRLILSDDLDWLKKHLGTVVKLTDDESFQTSVEALCTYMMASNDRMKVAQLWAGVEAIFDIEYELRYRLATLTAHLLHPRGKKRRERYDHVKTLYGERSKIIHGKQLNKKKDQHETKVREHIGQMRTLLAELLTWIVEHGSVPDESDFEELLFEK